MRFLHSKVNDSGFPALTVPKQDSSIAAPSPGFKRFSLVPPASPPSSHLYKLAEKATHCEVTLREPH